MIYEGSCDTEYRCNDAENSALRHRNKLLLEIHQISKNVFSYFFNHINAALNYGEHKQLLSKTKKNLIDPKPMNGSVSKKTA